VVFILAILAPLVPGYLSYRTTAFFVTGDYSHAIASAIGAPTLFATEKVALASGFLGFSANFIATLVVTLVVLVTLIYVKRDIYIPKGTRYLSRKEKSHLLND